MILLFVLPALPAIALLWRNGHLPWMIWVVMGLSAFAWMASKTMLLTKSELQRGIETDRSIFAFWELVANLAIWTHWLVCVAAIILALVVK